MIYVLVFLAGLLLGGLASIKIFLYGLLYLRHLVFQQDNLQAPTNPSTTPTPANASRHATESHASGDLAHPFAEPSVDPSYDPNLQT